MKRFAACLQIRRRAAMKRLMFAGIAIVVIAFGGGLAYFVQRVRTPQEFYNAGKKY